MAAQMNEELQRLWLKQLLREFEDICFQYRVNLQPPIIELSAAVRQSGCWLPCRRTIRISRLLIENHPWNVVLMVLKHEMAHQACSELLGSTSCGHGKTFQQACAMLGVPPPYNRAGGDLPLRESAPPEEQMTKKGRRVVERIAKLLALAGSDNEHEAALAMQRATELLFRHNLDQTAVAADAGYTHTIIHTNSRQIPTYRRTICAILRDYFFIQVICSSLFDPRTGNTCKTIELLGRAENVPVAEHCYHFLEQQLESLWRHNGHRFSGNRRTARNSYFLGILHGFAEKLAVQTTGDQPPGSCSPSPGALIISRDGRLQDFVDFRFPRLRRRSARGIRIYNQPYDNAKCVGRKLTLHCCVTERKQGVLHIPKR